MSNVEEDDGTEPEPTLTMVDYFEETIQQEIKAIAVLGPTEGDHCSYDQGYLKRQGLYSCRTCQTDPENLAGVCVPCSYACHDGHDLVELYTKRDFRCDCGNSKFPQNNPCKLRPNKDSINEKNKYGHNFLGLYCTCRRPWPDPNDYDPKDSMFQCTICEDWFHPRHLDAPCPPPGSFQEVICQMCTEKLPFLKYYSGLSVTAVSAEKEADESTTPERGVKRARASDVEVTDEPKANGSENATLDTSMEEDKSKVSEPSTEDKSDALSEPSTSKDQPGPSTSSGATCLLDGQVPIERKGGATFWTDNYRDFLCTCSKCKAMYERLGVPFMTQKEDTLTFYEEKAIRTKETEYERGMKALSTLPRTSQVECLQNFEELKSELTEYLSPFAASNKVVKKEDIMNFFSQLQARKRRRLDGAPPYACR